MPDHEELAAAERFNMEMAELAELEHQHELRSLLIARITGKGNLICFRIEDPFLRGNRRVSLFFFLGISRVLAPLSLRALQQ